MATPTIQIRLKGAKALAALGKNGGGAGLQLQLGTMTKGGLGRVGEVEGARGGVGQAVMARGGEVEGARGGIGKAVMARGGELEGARGGLGKAVMARGGEMEGARMVSGTREVGSHHLGGLSKAKSATSVGVVTPKGAGAVVHGAGAVKGASAGTIWSGTGMSLGIGLGLGGYGPLLLLGVVALTATGIYLWQRERAKEQELEDLDDFDDFDDLDDGVEVVDAIS